MKKQEQISLEHGKKWPFDASDTWWESSDYKNTPKSKDWAHYAARGIIANLQDRRGIKQELTNEIDEDIRTEIVSSMTDIIKEAHRQLAPKEYQAILHYKSYAGRKLHYITASNDKKAIKKLKDLCKNVFDTTAYSSAELIRYVIVYEHEFKKE